MPFIPHTPESLLRRADSKNPATTCKGITTSGIHCRRSLASSPHLLSRHKDALASSGGVLAVLEPGEGDDEDGAAAYFCWQHKDQAVNLVNDTKYPKRAGSVIQLKKRTSIDTLADRLGLLDVHSEEEIGFKEKQHTREKRAHGKERLPRQWQNVDGPVISIPAKRYHQKAARPTNRQRKKSQSGFAVLCCMTPAETEHAPPSRVEKFAEKQQTSRPATAPIPVGLRRPPPDHNSRRAYSGSRPANAVPRDERASTAFKRDHRPQSSRDPPSQTQTFLSLIPRSLSPETTSALLAELAKPISPHDEPGYIYIFHLLPDNSDPMDATAAQSLLSNGAGPTCSPRSSRRRSSLAPTGSTGVSNAQAKLLLKIGRASNVQRRMNEWSRQCGYDLSLLRFYPYISASSTNTSSPRHHPPSPIPSPNTRRHHGPTLQGGSSSSNSNNIQSQPGMEGFAEPQKVPHAHKVERLIHLELADMRVKRGCDACGKEHREWFEVDGTTERVREVDAVVRRWVGWAEGTVTWGR